MAVNLNIHDLTFVLQQIKIAEAHANGTPLADLVGDPRLPFGLRTVDGTLNNLVEGRETWGAADQIMPRLFDPTWRNEQDGDSFDPDGPFGPSPAVTNTDYGSAVSVADVDPRLISNLIVDQSPNNPAAIASALSLAGYEGSQALAIAAIRTEWQNLQNGVITRAEFETSVATYGIAMEGDSLLLPNVAPDEGLSAPFNAWMTFFGQFFDHGLDLISKGGAGTVYVPLQPDDPLYVEGGFTNFMVLTRATQTAGPGEDGIMGTADDTRDTTNVTTPFVDQNQTYTSHPSHQVFLREYEMVDGRPVATGHLLEGVNGGLATWADVKAQARDMLGIVLTDKDVGNIPLVRVDAYGKFIPDENGFAQVITGLGADGVPNTEDDIVVSGTPEIPVHLLLGIPGETVPEGPTATPLRTNHAFLDDIAHNAAPVVSGGNLVQDADSATGNAVASFQGRNTEYDNELLDRHFITGDGRGNENIGLTAVHHVFHSEHNRQVEATKLTVLKSGDAEFINEWLTIDVTQAEVDTLAAMTPAQLAVYAENASWDGERMFQAARFATEMQYQHLVFEEFGRKIQPNIDPFVFNTTTDIDPAIFAEFAHVVYRFGHSMLTEDVGRMFLDEAGNPVSYDANGVPVPVTDLETWGNDIGLIEAFLNPVEFDQDRTISHEQAAGAIFRGMNITHGNQIDEFVTDALRSNLLGLPLDLAAINIARGRDTGMPSLNEAREQLYDASGSSFLTPYASWAEFGANLKTPMSVINFIAAYGTHQSIIDAGDNIAARRDAATALVLGAEGESPEQREARIAWLNGPAAETGVNDIDLWIGGLAEKQMPFGGFLGSTFNAVFEMQMEILQDNDRFYYLTRTQGLNLLNELENNAFSKLVMANTDMTRPGPDGIRGTSDDILDYHTGVDSFALHDHVLHVDPTKQIGPDPTYDDAVLNGLGQTRVQRDNLATPGVDQNYIKYVGGEHTAINGTQGNDTIIGGWGDDAIWGGAGDDRIEGGAGVDLIIGGAGNDIITDSGDTGDFIKGEDGDDVIANSNGLDILMGGKGKDVFIVGVDMTEVFAGEGDDFILGGADADFLMGNEGDDWIEGGGGFDTTAGDNSELFFNSTIIGHDVMFAGDDEHDFDAESGDDIMVQGESVMRNEGMLGFDWASHQGSKIAANSDLTIKIFATEMADILRNRFDQTEALSGSNHDDILRGDDRGSVDVIGPEGNMIGHELTQAGVDRISGLREALGLPPRGDAPDDEVVFAGGNILMGGAGSDLLEGRGGDDIIDGDARLHVRISIMDPSGQNEIATVTSLSQLVTLGGVTKPLSSMLLSGEVKPAQMHIVREIVDDGLSGDQDTAVFYDELANYQITANPGGGFIVTHVNPTLDVIDPFTGARRVSDGSDTVRNVEWLQFADQRVSTAASFTNASGAAVIDDTTPTEGQTLTVDVSSISDTSGIASFSIQWQQSANGIDWVDIPGAVGEQFTPEDLPGTAAGAQAGQLLRAAFNYVDDLGFAKTLLSAPTGVTGVNWQADVATTFNGTTGDDILNGSAGNDTLQGGAGNDLVAGNGGNDVLEGGTGTDTTVGGTGNDVHIVDNAADVVIEATGGGTDRVHSSVDYALAAGVDIEFLTTTSTSGTDAVNLRGNELAQFIDGNNGINTLEGGGGNDRILGRGGNDTLLGGEGNDVLEGGTGTDTTVGGTGNDVHIVDNAADVVIEATGGGTDRVHSSVDYALAAGVDIEFLTTTSTSGTDAVNLRGNELAQFIDGNNGINTLEGGGGNDRILGRGGNDTLLGGEGNDVLEGGTGTDTTVGGTGNDVHIVDNAADVVIEATGGGTDRVHSSVDYALAAGVDIEFLTTTSTSGTDAVNLRGNELAQFIDGNNGINTLEGGGGNDRILGRGGNDTLLGGEGNDVLEGGTGTDTTVGGTGNDVHIVDNAADVVIEATGGGTDRVHSSVDYALAAGVDIEFLTTTSTSGTDAVNLRGNELAQFIDGNNGINTLEGGGGNDRILGRGGNDTLLGGEGNDVLEGGTGTDTTVGGTGNDVHIVDNAADVVIEATGGGTDRVHSSVDYALAAGVDIEFLTTTSTSGTDAVNLRGNELAQFIDGNNGINTLEGGGGNDRILGRGGNDTFVQTGAIDGRDSLNGGDGTDTWVLNAAAGESYTIYTRAEALAAGMTGISGFTEIVVTLNGSTNASIIAELDNIEEIVIDSVNVASGGGVNGGNTASGATIAVIGNFDSTSLDYSTITINGGTGDETINIQGLTSAHRVVFNGEGGNDRLIGDARPQDSIPFAGAQLSGPIDAARRSQLAAGIGLAFLNEGQYTPADSFVEQLSMQGDVETLARAARIAENASLLPEPAQNIVLNGSTAAVEAIGEAKAASAASNHDHGALQNARHSADDGHGHDRSGVKDDKIVEFGHKVTGFSTSGDDLIVGTAGDDYLVGGSGDDVIHGGAGDDTLRGGSGDDVLHGGSGDDVLEGGSGNDVLDGGTGDDTLTGGSGADIFVFGSDDSVQDFAVGEDLLDISALGVDEAGFADAVKVVQQGADTAVTIGSATMILRNVDTAEIDVASFHLAGPPDAAASSTASTMELQFGTLARLDEVDGGDSFAAMFFANDTVALPHAATSMDSGNPAELGILMSGSRFNGTMSDPLDQVTQGFVDQFVVTGLPPETSLHDILKAYHDNQEEPPLGAVNSDNFLF